MNIYKVADFPDENNYIKVRISFVIAKDIDDLFKKLKANSLTNIKMIEFIKQNIII